MTNCINCGHPKTMHAHAKIISKEYDNADILTSACYECGKCWRFEP